jgi:FPC/CPF motif-containing protein YcgG
MPQEITEEEFEKFIWQRLQCLSDADAKMYPFDKRVSTDPGSPEFSFSLKSEAFFIIGLHKSSNRAARRFKYPTIVFNPHAAFIQLRQDRQYDKMKKIVRRKDMELAGSINPMLDDFGKSSEVFQYSGKNYQSSWQCPLQINHGKTNHSPA